MSISIQNGTNVVLGWPSVPGATYIIQSTPALNSSNGWQTLTNFYPAAPSTNWTTYVISNAISLSSGGGGGGTNGGSGGGGPPSMGAIVAGSNITSSEASSPFPDLEPGDIMFPPSPWIPETLPGGAILKANGTYAPLSPMPESGGTATPDNGSWGGSDPGFYVVVQNGVTCVGLTNGMTLSGTVTIPLEIAVPASNYISGAELYVDGTNAPGGGAVIGPLNLWTIYWDTTYASNGKHQISAQVTFSEDSVAINATNLLTVTVTNVVTFPYYYATVFGQGVGMWIYAQSAVPDVEWEVEVYGSQTNDLGTLGPFSTPNGLLSVGWGLQTNEGGAALTDPAFRLDYYLYSTVTGKWLFGGKPAASKWKIAEAPWTASGMVVACAPIDANNNHTAQVGTLVQNAVVNTMYGNVNAANGGLQPLGWNQANGQSAWMWNQSGNGEDLLAVMPSCSYFYYFGHGLPDSFGMGHWSLYDPPSASNIWYNDITTFLVNQTLHNWPTASFPTNSHPYRLVFIDGCQSAGGGLPAAFGIPTGQFSTNYFLDAGVPCRAFVGYSEPVSIIITQIPDYYDMLQSFWNGWLQDRSVHEMVTNCQSAAKFSLFAMSSSAVIDGCPALFRGGP